MIALSSSKFSDLFKNPFSFSSVESFLEEEFLYAIMLTAESTIDNGVD
jgi:hypothetical protein